MYTLNREKKEIGMEIRGGGGGKYIAKFSLWGAGRLPEITDHVCTL